MEGIAQEYLSYARLQHRRYAMPKIDLSLHNKIRLSILWNVRLVFVDVLFFMGVFHFVLYFHSFETRRFINKITHD
uniref:Uncharacterized protein n=1 Tax=Agrobacterium tumefaciens TaxID=358 RepID=A0A5B9T1B1_AGRTU|nr:hypothetical protein AgrTiKerr108_00016 [Agrobacterium tumefaciens]